MSNTDSSEIPGCTLPGAQDKVQAELIDGRYVACQSPGPLHIPAFPAPPLDPRKVAEFRNQPGPPSVVDTIIGRHRKAYEVECTYRQLAIESSRAIVELSGFHLSEDGEALQEQYIRGEITVRECIDEIKRRYGVGTYTEDNTELLADFERKAMRRRQRLFDAGALITEEQLRDVLDISRQVLEQTIRDSRLFYIDGTAGERWYPSFLADASIRANVERVCLALAGLSGEVMFQFFMTPKHSLGRKTPIAAISNWYEVDRVLSTAAEFKQRNLSR